MAKWIKLVDAYYNIDKIEKIDFSTDDYGYERYFITINNYKYQVDRQQFYKLRDLFLKAVEDNLL